MASKLLLRDAGTIERNLGFSVWAQQDIQLKHILINWIITMFVNPSINLWIKIEVMLMSVHWPVAVVTII